MKLLIFILISLLLCTTVQAAPPASIPLTPGVVTSTLEVGGSMDTLNPPGFHFTPLNGTAGVQTEMRTLMDKDVFFEPIFAYKPAIYRFKLSNSDLAYIGISPLITVGAFDDTPRVGGALITENVEFGITVNARQTGFYVSSDKMVKTIFALIGKVPRFVGIV
jgi:hypothetical protein